MEAEHLASASFTKDNSASHGHGPQCIISITAVLIVKKPSDSRHFPKGQFFEGGNLDGLSHYTAPFVSCPDLIDMYFIFTHFHCVRSRLRSSNQCRSRLSRKSCRSKPLISSRGKLSLF